MYGKFTVCVKQLNVLWCAGAT